MGAASGLKCPRRGVCGGVAADEEEEAEMAYGDENRLAEGGGEMGVGGGAEGSEVEFVEA